MGFTLQGQAPSKDRMVPKRSHIINVFLQYFFLSLIFLEMRKAHPLVLLFASVLSQNTHGRSVWVPVAGPSGLICSWGWSPFGPGTAVCCPSRAHSLAREVLIVEPELGAWFSLVVLQAPWCPGPRLARYGCTRPPHQVPTTSGVKLPYTHLFLRG